MKSEEKELGVLLTVTIESHTLWTNVGLKLIKININDTCSM